MLFTWAILMKRSAITIEMAKLRSSELCEWFLCFVLIFLHVLCVLTSNDSKSPMHTLIRNGHSNILHIKTDSQQILFYAMLSQTVRVWCQFCWFYNTTLLRIILNKVELVSWISIQYWQFYFFSRFAFAYFFFFVFPLSLYYLYQWSYLKCQKRRPIDWNVFFMPT